jgi:anti-anti-sigma regulatory factor
MPKKGKPCLLKIEQTLTAFDVQKELEHLVTWIQSLAADSDAAIDASTVEKIDTAGCQFIDMALTAGRKKCKKVEISLSPMVAEALQALGVEHEAE